MGKLKIGGNVLWIKSQRTALIGGAFFEAIFLRKFASDQMVDRRIATPSLQSFIAEFFFFVILASQVCDDGLHRDRFLVGRIDVQDLLERRFGGFVLLRINRVVGHHQQTGNVIFV